MSALKPSSFIQLGQGFSQRRLFPIVPERAKKWYNSRTEKTDARKRLRGALAQLRLQAPEVRDGLDLMTDKPLSKLEKWLGTSESWGKPWQNGRTSAILKSPPPLESLCAVKQYLKTNYGVLESLRPDGSATKEKLNAVAEARTALINVESVFSAGCDHIGVGVVILFDNI